MQNPQDRLGQQIGDYRLQRQLGRGTFGTVYLAEHVHDRSQAAVKLLQLQVSSREDLRDFLNEARIMRLHHPHIVSVLDFGLSREDLPYLVMEYATGGTLRDRHARGSKVPAAMVVTYVLQLASALQYAHDRRIIHRDVKPENMLLKGDGNVLLSDFGIAKIMEQNSFKSAQTNVGTPVYMAPEQSQGRPHPASDQYALAVVVYEWFAGQRPFEGGIFEVMLQHRMDAPPSLRALCPELSEQAEQVIFTAMAKAPEERFPTVMDFAHALHAVLQSTLPLPQIATTPPTIETRNLTETPPVPVQPLPPLDQQTQQTQQAWPVPSQPATELSMRQDTLDAWVSSPPPTNPTSWSTTKMRSSPQSVNYQQIQATPTYAQSSTSHPRPGQSIFVIFLCFVVLTAGGIGTWLFVTSQAQQNTLIATRLSATAAAQAYDTATAKSGVQFGFDAAHTHWNPYEQVITEKNVKDLTLLWSYTTGSIFSSSPIVANGVVYAGSYDGKLYALDARCRRECQPLWSYQIASPVSEGPSSSLAIANGILYTGSYEGKLYAFDAGCRSGCQPLWSYPTGNGIFYSPVIANGVAYVGSWDGKLYAFGLPEQ